MAVKYMEAGIEAFHCGQVMLMASMGDSENGYAGYRILLSKIREAATTKAARGTVLLDAHLGNGGTVVDGDCSSTSCRSRCGRRRSRASR